MTSSSERIQDFLAQKRIAVAGVSRTDKDSPANLIYRKLRDHGYQAVALNPKTERVEGDACWPCLRALPVAPDGVVACTPPEATEALVEECIEVGVPRIWMHRSIDAGSLSRAAVERAESAGMTVIAGGCPMMHVEPDIGHRCMHWALRLVGRIPA